MLGVRDRMTLALAAAPYASPARKVTAMRVEVGYTETAFWARVDQLLDDPAAEAEMPAAVHRLKALREARRAVRVA